MFMFSGFGEVCDILLYLTEARQEQHRSLGTYRSEFGASRGRLFSGSFSRNTRGNQSFTSTELKSCFVCSFISLGSQELRGNLLQQRRFSSVKVSCPPRPGLISIFVLIASPRSRGAGRQRSSALLLLILRGAGLESS